MKNSANGFSKKIITNLTVITLLLIGSVHIKGQSMLQKNTITSVVEQNYEVKQFTIKNLNNKLYFKFIILENSENTDYALEYSSNGKDFLPIQSKEGFKSPASTPLLYCYTVNEYATGKSVYRIRRTTLEGDTFTENIEIDLKGKNQKVLTASN